MTASPPRLLGSALLGAALLLGGCSSDVNPVRDAFTAVGAGPPATRPQDFVARSRPDAYEYRPVGDERSTRRLKAKSAAEVNAAEAELEALRARNDQSGAAARAAVPTN